LSFPYIFNREIWRGYYWFGRIRERGRSFSRVGFDVRGLEKRAEEVG